MKVIAFSKYLSYMLGGAEKSTLEILKKEAKNGNDIEIISFDDIQMFHAKGKKVVFSKEWELNFIEDIFCFNRFFYFEYCFNRKKLKDYFSKLDVNNTLYTYAMYAPIAINSFQGRTKLFIRSETDLAINKNYYTGLKRLLKYIYIILEYPAYLIYKSDLKKAIIKADVICNSKYMATKLKNIFNKDSKVLYPFIDIQKLQEEYASVQNSISNKGVVFVGDAIIKGIDIVKELAHNLPHMLFFIFSRNINFKKQEKNIIWMPWQKKEVNIYKYAKVVIVPSIWEEAYGRVSAEAFALNIPVLVSNIGGLPESVGNKKEYIVDDYQNTISWKKKIEKYY